MERESSGAKIFGVDPMVALIIGAVLLVVIVVGLVAMSRRTGETSAIITASSAVRRG